MSDINKNNSLKPHQTHVPLPSEAPKNIDFSQFPQEVLRSSAVETLIQQNEDLMARLKVNLRRVSQLEDKLSDGEKFQKKFKFHFENLREQSLILKEKCSSLESRKDDQLEKMNELAERNKALEVEYARLYSESKEQKEQLLTSIEQLSKRLSRLLKYKKNISPVAKSLRGTHRHLENKLINEQNKIHELENQLNQSKKQLSESTEYIQNQGFNHKKELDQLTRSYEEKIGKLETDLEIIQHENSKLKPFLNENIKLQNKKIENERKFADKLEKSRQEILSGQSQISDLKAQIKTQQKELQQMNKLKQDLAEQTSENKKLRVQLETTQGLWNEAQKDTEQLSERNTALQKLNQNLSMTLNKYRLEIQNLKNKVHAPASDLRKRQEASELALQNSDAVKKNRESDIPQRLESLIAEIEMGQ